MRDESRFQDNVLQSGDVFKSTPPLRFIICAFSQLQCRQEFKKVLPAVPFGLLVSSLSSCTKEGVGVGEGLKTKGHHVADVTAFFSQPPPPPRATTF